MLRVGAFSMMAATLALVASASADTLWVSSGGGNALQYDDIKILRVDGDKIVFTNQAGRETTKELRQVVRMKITDEPALNSAEEAFEKADWPAATTAYEQVAKSTGKSWIKDWADMRLLESANKTGNFAAAYPVYLKLLVSDPASASKLKPTLPDAKSPALDPAFAAAEKLLADSKLTDDQKRALLAFQAEIQRLKGDNRSALALAQKMTNLSSLAAGSDGQIKLEMAKIALAEKDYLKAQQTIESNRAAFTDPAQQADALFIVATARYNLAKDDAALKDAALAYMRVVAHFSNAESKPHVAESLLMTALIHEKLKDPDSALRIYERLLADFKNDPSAAQATQKIQQLKTAPKGG